ncbi:MAG TPA: dUTP diphosphatase [Candidatus Diapherotrites archaeon]|uniref:dUTP diphosphatase n=1 Tax=Candidatus Iainarchaeum sp. TaxID=3101447 RepID=A0A7J4JKB2_9ARCH|nr:dUTP diphosphatase [Candidatus Diapherotrites archaeon]HIH16367.1 dUTP diphosphatase [Candidatus Diapherotrites archaeon]
MKLLVKRVSADARLPAYEHEGDSGLDLYATESCEIKPGQRRLVPTGLKIAVPKGFEAQVRPKSGLALKEGITVLNAPGTIDAGYRGEIGVIVINHGERPFKAEKGKKIAQLVLARVEQAEVTEVSELEATTRNESGFGSTGLH